MDSATGKEVEPAKMVENAGDDDVIKPDHESPVVMPESLRNMSDGELKKLETKMVRKMDLVIM